MKKIGLLLGVVLYSVSMFGQDFYMHPCAEHKIKVNNSSQKKSRASTNDVALMSKYDVHNYHLNISAENNSLVVSGSTIIGAKAITSVDTFAFELHAAHTIDSIKYNGVNILSFHLLDIGYAILPSTITPNSNFEITIFYRGTCPNTGSSAIGYGFNTDNSPSWGNNVTWSLSQPFSAYQWFPCKQFLQDKADSSSVNITTSSFNKAGSNGLLIGIDSLPNNKVTYKWKSNLPIDYYLISIAVAKYVDYSIYAYPSNLPNDSILIQNYVYDNPGTLPNFKGSIDTQALMMEHFSEIVYPYPFKNEKYGVCMAPFTGGMEHQTMSSQGFFEFTLNAHEMFHQWFGDHVTCKTWSDIFVNEGFASYGEYLSLAKWRSYTAAQNDMRNVHARVKSQMGGSIYFTDTTNARIFSSRLSYDKGAAIIHSLRFELGDSIFFRTLNNYQAQFAFSTATINDFKSVAENTSGKNLSLFFNQWIYGEGFPIIDAQYSSNGNAIILKINHNGSVASNNLYTTPLEVKCQSANGDTTVLLNINQNSHTFYIPSNKVLTGILIDPNNWILDSVRSKTMNPDLLLGLRNNNKHAFKLYPNPTKGIFFVKCDVPIVQYKIFNMQGANVQSGFVNSSQQIVFNQVGIYWVQCVDQFNQTYQQKLIVQP